MIRYYIREPVQDQHLHYTSHQKNENTFRFFSLKTNIEFYSLKQIAHYYSWQFGPSNDYDNSKLKIRFFNRLWDKFSVSVYNIYWCKLVFRVSAHVMNDLKITNELFFLFVCQHSFFIKKTWIFRYPKSFMCWRCWILCFVNSSACYGYMATSVNKV